MATGTTVTVAKSAAAAAVATNATVVTGVSTTQACTCQSTDLVGMLVYVTGVSIAGLPAVTRCDPTLPQKMPGIGLITAKASPTACTVTYAGIVPAAGVVVGQKYFVGLDGTVTSVLPDQRPFLLQPVGVGVGPGQLLFNPQPFFFGWNK